FKQLWFYNVFGLLFMVFGFAALLLASIGLYGVMAFSVSRRRQEVGVRMALGASAVDVVTMVLRQGLGQLGLGVLFGLGLALLLSQGLSLVLFQVEPWDPLIFAAIATTLVLTGLLACYLPARRAARVDPVTALRGE
ncbi:MAG: FtsX-like permease family protein, partial [Acidobacteria bacterium]|nr:FtsX-like permease family protein [Acidobacteriota bacterium]